MNRQILKGIVFVGLFAIPFVPFFVSGVFFFPFITTKAFTWRIIVEIVFAAWLMLALMFPEYRLKRSPILYAVLAFIFVIGLADLFGVEPIKSFWSNFERMEGYITMLHLGAFFMVISSVFKDREWNWWWNTSLAASALMIVYSLLQLSGSPSFPIHQGGVRVDGTLGNASYLALYFLIHIFVAIFYLAKSKTTAMRWTYTLLVLGQTVILYFTATRGAILGLIGGFFIIALLNIKNRENPQILKMSRYALIALVVFIFGFFLARNTKLVKQSPVLNRFSTLSISAWKTEGRAYVWPMAIEGIKQRPILGWGQDNFNYVFAKNYSAQMFRLEPWFDRAHNIFLDWAVAGGLLGLGAYLALYVVLLKAIWKEESLLSHAEKSVLTGLIGAYFFNNIFVFDNLISYVLFFSLLAYLHARVGKASQTPLKSFSGQSAIFTLIPVGFVIMGIIYFVNIKPIIANTRFITALQVVQGSGSKVGSIAYFKKAYEGSRLGRPEVVEWIASSASTVLSDQSIPIEERNKYFSFIKEVIEKTTEELNNDPRYEIVAGTFYSSVGLNEDAIRHFNKAQVLMPEKQVIYFSLAQAEIQKGDTSKALSYLKTAYALAPDYYEAQLTYAIGAIYAGDKVLENQLKEAIYRGDSELEAELKKKGEKPANTERWATDDRIITAYLKMGRYLDIIDLLKRRIERDPLVAQNYISLSAAYLEIGDSSSAKRILTTLVGILPQYKETVDQYIKKIQEGKKI